MALTLYYHPLSSFCWKALVGLYEKEIPFRREIVDLQDPAGRAAFEKIWPIGKFPVLRDEAAGSTIPESSMIIEYLELRYPDGQPLLPRDAERALQARLWDRLYDSYFQLPMQRIVSDRLRPDGEKDPRGVAEARVLLDKAYGFASDALKVGPWTVGTMFSLADCAAAPALYYADRVHSFGPAHGVLSDYLGRLRARPSFARVLKEAEPYLAMFPA